MALKEELKQEIASVRRDIVYRSFSGVLRQEDDTLLTRGGGKGLRLYDEIARDCHVYSVLQKRSNAVIAREWVVDPASGGRADRKAAELVKEQLRNLKFDRVCKKLLGATLKGFSVGEIIWETDGREIVASKVLVKRQERFVFDIDKKLRLLTWEAPLVGEELPDRKFVVNRFGGENDDNPYGLGLGHKLFWPVFFKRQGITFWLTFADKFGSPTAVGKYPPGTTREDQDKLYDALAAIAQDTGITIPEGMAIEYLEASRGGSINTYESLCRYMDEQISEAVLGETLSTNIGDKGSLAASQTHNEVRTELAKGDADLLSDTINETLVRWIVEFNVPGANPPKVWRDFTESEDLKERSDIDKTIFDMGFTPDEDYINERYGGNWKKGSRPAPQTKQTDAASFAEGPAFPDQQAIDDLAGSLSPKELQRQAEGVLKPVIDLINGGKDYEAVLETLSEAYPEMDDGAVQEMLARAIFISEAWGRLNSGR